MSVGDLVYTHLCSHFTCTALILHPVQLARPSMRSLRGSGKLAYMCCMCWSSCVHQPLTIVSSHICTTSHLCLISHLYNLSLCVSCSVPPLPTPFLPHSPPPIHDLSHPHLPAPPPTPPLLHQVKPDTVIEVWKSGLDKMAAVTAAGLRGIYSTCWYLNIFYYGADDHWKQVRV